MLSFFTKTFQINVIGWCYGFSHEDECEYEKDEILTKINSPKLDSKRGTFVAQNYF